MHDMDAFVLKKILEFIENNEKILIFVSPAKHSCVACEA